MIESLVNKLKRSYSLTDRKDHFPAEPRKLGRRLSATSYTIGQVGKMMVTEVSSTFGFTKREIAVLAPLYRDLPLFCAESRRIRGKDSLWIGLADVMLAPLPEDFRDAFRELKAFYDDLPSGEETWTRDLPFYDFSLAVSGPEVSLKKEAIVRKYFMLYSEFIEKAPASEPEAKKEKVKELTGHFLETEHPLTLQLTKLLGREETEAFYNSIF